VKTRLLVVIATAAIVASLLAHFFRYEIVTGNNPHTSVVYRLDRFTGRVEWSAASTKWQTIPEK
jgi:hypothetical protein